MSKHVRLNPLALLESRPRHISSSKMVRLNPISMKEDLFIGLAAAAAIGGGYYWWYKKGNPTVTLVPGTMTTSVKSGGTVTLALPSGATWVATGGVSASGVNAATPTGSANYPITNITAPTSYAASWKDSSGVVQNTAVTITIAT